MGYCLNRLDEPVFIAVSKPLLTEFGIHHRLESCVIDCSSTFYGTSNILAKSDHSCKCAAAPGLLSPSLQHPLDIYFRQAAAAQQAAAAHQAFHQRVAGARSHPRECSSISPVSTPPLPTTSRLGQVIRCCC